MISIRDLSVWFHSTGSIYALKDVSMDIRDQASTVMIGETGSGKSVLIQAILQLLPPTAHCSGQVWLDGVDLLSLSQKKMRWVRGQKIGYVPQGNGNAMNPLLRVGFQVAEPMMEHQKLRKRDAIDRAIPLLKRFHLGDETALIRFYPHVLSGGMRQRTMIAMGIAANAPVLFADEPTKGLDEMCICEVVEAFRQLKTRTLLCVTHDLSFARAIADRIVVMYTGMQMEEADADAFFAEPMHPYSKALLASQAEHGFQCEIGFAPSKTQIPQGGCVFMPLCPHAHERCKNTPPMFNVAGRKVRCWQYES